MLTWILLSIVPIFAVVSIAIQLGSRRKDKYQRIVHALFYRTQRPGEGAWGLGPWYYGSWDVGEKVNASITEGRTRYSHERSHHPYNPHKHHRQQR